jgi:class 3 adenylate cyclase
LAQVLGVTVDWLLEAPERPDVLEAAVLFSSVRGAYEKSLGMEARDFAAWANGLFFSLTETTLQHGGVPIKYMGDQYLCFFSGSGRRERALTVALRARGVVTEDLTIGLSCGEIYLGAMGHPDYARPDIMGQVVNAAYLAMQWAEDNTESGIAATAGVAEGMEALAGLGAFTEVSFRDIAEPLRLCEVRAKQAAWNDNCN